MVGYGFDLFEISSVDPTLGDRIHETVHAEIHCTVSQACRSSQGTGQEAFAGSGSPGDQYIVTPPDKGSVR